MGIYWGGIRWWVIRAQDVKTANHGDEPVGPPFDVSEELDEGIDTQERGSGEERLDPEG